MDQLSHYRDGALWQQLWDRKEWHDNIEVERGKSKLKIMLENKNCTRNTCNIVLFPEDGKIYVNNTTIDEQWTLQRIDQTILRTLGISNLPPLRYVTFGQFNQVSGVVAGVDAKAQEVLCSPGVSTNDKSGKNNVDAVVGESGSGKTTYACFVLGKGTHVCYTALDSEKVENFKQIATDREKRNSASEALFFSLLKSALTPVDPETPTAKSDPQPPTAKSDPQPRTAKSDPQARTAKAAVEAWLKDPAPGDTLDEPLTFVIDEISHCLDFGRGIVAKQDDIYSSDWVKRHFSKGLRIVLCGTGAEEFSKRNPSIATDPTRIQMHLVGATTKGFRDKVLHSVVPPRTTNTDSKLLIDTISGNALFGCIRGNTRLLVLACDEVRKYLMDTEPELAIPLLCYSTVLPNLLEKAIMRYTRLNGLMNIRTPEQRRCVDAVLIHTLQQHAQKDAPQIVSICVPPNLDKLLDDAARYGLLVRDKDEDKANIMSPAMVAVSTFGFNAPRESLGGDELEYFCARWLLRLLQLRYQARLVRLQGQVPTLWEWGLSEMELDSIVKALASTRCVVMLNGHGAPGADVMAVERYDGDGNSVGRVTVLSAKRNRDGEDAQLKALLGTEAGQEYRRTCVLFLALLLSGATAAEIFAVGTRSRAAMVELLRMKLGGRKVRLVVALVGGGVCGATRTVPNVAADSDFFWVDPSWKGQYLVCGPDSFGPLGPLVATRAPLKLTHFCSKYRTDQGLSQNVSHTAAKRRRED